MLGYLLSPVLQIEDVNGLPLVNGKVYVYEANTSNLATIYSNYEGTLNTNPAILDLAGHTTIIADDEMMYDITVKDNDDNLLFTAKDVAVGGEGGSAIVSDVTVRGGGNGISVVQSVENNTKVFTVSIDYNFVASKTDLNSKQNTLTPGDNISISGDTISVTGLKAINVAAPLQKTETTSAINLSIDTSGIQTTLSAGTNIDAVKLSNGFIDLKHDNCSASINSIAIGQETLASGNCSFAEGKNTSAVGDYSHSEGDRTRAIGEYSHVEGTRTSALNYGDHAEGHSTVASGEYSHAEGYGSNSIGYQSHAEGYQTSAFGSQSHSEGDRTQSIGYQSHAEGYRTSAVGAASHAEGQWTIASGAYQTVIGKYNAPNETDLFQIGCGTTDNDRRNVVEVKNDNSIWYNYNDNMVQLKPSNNYYGNTDYMPTYYTFTQLDGSSGIKSILNVPNLLNSSNIEKLGTNDGYKTSDDTSQTFVVDADCVIKIDALPADSSLINIAFGVDDTAAGSRRFCFYDTGMYFIHITCIVNKSIIKFFGRNDSNLVGGGDAKICLGNITMHSI